jgi:Prenyltransferase and squalene oxidase repeat
MELYDEDGNLVRVDEKKPGWWDKLGGQSLMIAAALHLILLLAGAFWVFKTIYPPEKKVDFMPPGGGGGERGAEQVAVKKRAQITPTTSVKRVFAEGAAATFAIPEQGDNFGEMSTLSSLSGGGMSGGLGGAGSGKGFGKGAGVGAGMGVGGGAGKLFGLIPETMRKRCSKEDRLQRLKDNGGTPACEDAVSKSLQWLKANQNADGSWGEKQKPAMTGLALLAYFGHCETPISEEFGESSMKGIVYLVNVALKNDGKIASHTTEKTWCYEHAIGTYALGEAATFCKDLKIVVPSLPEMAQKAGQYIIENQNINGGWAYFYATADKSHTDVSIVGWQLQALKACSHIDLKFKGMDRSVAKGLDYLNSCQNQNGGYGYSSKNSPSLGKDYFTLTGVGMLCHQMWGKGNRAEVRKGADYVSKNTKFDYNTTFCDLYGHYYESQAMMQMGGRYWKDYNDLFRDQILNNQNQDGTWKIPGGGAGRAAIRAGGAEFVDKDKDGTVYRNALCTLMLEVYYRFLNTGGGGLGDNKPKI